MAPVVLNETEQSCIHQLAEWYPRQSGGPCEFRVQLLATAISVSVDEARTLVMTMDRLGVVDDVYSNCGIIEAFNITYEAVQTSRKLRNAAEQKPDVIESLEAWVRRNRYTALPLIGFMLLGALITFVNQAVALGKSLGWFGAP